MKKLGERINNAETQRNKTAQNRSGNGQKPHRSSDRQLHIKVSGADRYDLRTDLHYHIICLKCGKVIDIPFNYLSDPDEKVANATGYTVFRHRAVFEGICPECKTENNI